MALVFSFTLSKASIDENEVYKPSKDEFRLGYDIFVCAVCKSSVFTAVGCAGGIIASYLKIIDDTVFVIPHRACVPKLAIELVAPEID